MYENGNTSGSGDADDLVPMIMWVLCQSRMISAEVEADYMWGLLLPSAASGEASYYLEAFHSAIHALKNLSPSPEPSPGNSLDSVKPVSTSVIASLGFYCNCMNITLFLRLKSCYKNIHLLSNYMYRESRRVQ